MRNASIVRERHNGAGKGAGRLDQPRMSIDLSHLLGDDDLNKPKTERLKKRRRKYIALGVLIMVSTVYETQEEINGPPLPLSFATPTRPRFFFILYLRR